MAKQTKRLTALKNELRLQRLTLQLNEASIALLRQRIKNLESEIKKLEK